MVDYLTKANGYYETILISRMRDYSTTDSEITGKNFDVLTTLTGVTPPDL